jgi:hypothetical protein
MHRVIGMLPLSWLKMGSMVVALNNLKMVKMLLIVGMGLIDELSKSVQLT